MAIVSTAFDLATRWQHYVRLVDFVHFSLCIKYCSLHPLATIEMLGLAAHKRRWHQLITHRSAEGECGTSLVLTASLTL